MAAHAFNPSTLSGFLSSKLILPIYRVSSRTAKAIQRNPVSKKTNKKNHAYLRLKFTVKKENPTLASGSIADAAVLICENPALWVFCLFVCLFVLYFCRT